MKKAVILTLILIFALQASDNWWWNEPGPPVGKESEPLPGDITSGERKMLIIVSKFPEDTAVLRPALYDSLITDSMEHVDDSLYQWSVTNFLYTASWKQLEMTGEVNPCYTFPFYVTAPHSLQWYRDRFLFTFRDGSIVDTFERDIIGVVDDFLDFNDYDADSNGCVDYVFFIHPLDPTSGFVRSSSNPTPDSSNQGFAANWNSIVTSDTFEARFPGQNDYVEIDRRARCGSAMSFYHPDSTERIDRAAATNLICHEFGHSFGTPGIDYIKYSDGRFHAFLPDRYDKPLNSNLYAGSGGIGKYSVMQLGYYTLHPQLYTPWERMVFGWIEPAEITENSQNMILKDFNAYSTDLSQKAYVIPVDSAFIDPGVPHWVREYFLIANYQPSTHWLDDLGQTWPDSLREGPADSAHGVLVWHVNEWFWRPDSQTSELTKFEDLECAEGLMNLTGDGPSPMGTVVGWDRIDRWCPWAESRYNYEDWNELTGKGSTSHPHDFFNPAYKGAFHALTNPSSDGYNCDLRSYECRATTIYVQIS